MSKTLPNPSDSANELAAALAEAVHLLEVSADELRASLARAAALAHHPDIAAARANLATADRYVSTARATGLV